MTNPTTWLLLVVSLPTNSASGRTRIWRSLKALGCGALRDGAYLLPSSPNHIQQLRDLADETSREGGNAWLLTVQAQSGDEEAAYRSLFDRSPEHRLVLEALDEARKALPGSSVPEVSRALRKLRRDYEALRAIDYFPGDDAARTENAWIDFTKFAQRLLSPGEPQAVDAAIEPRAIVDFQGRVWATRRRPWVDRVASAWLIARFIDREARFLWLDSPADCPVDALGFDFDGATFTHIGERVTFEVLLASFGLAGDAGLARVGALVHALDAGGTFVPEASGFEAMLSGARQRTSDDDLLLAEMSGVLDALHLHFANDTPQAQTTKRETS
jgi:hypothetical protein